MTQINTFWNFPFFLFVSILSPVFCYSSEWTCHYLLFLFCRFLFCLSSLVIRELPLEQLAVFTRPSKWRLSGEDSEFRQPGPQLVDALQPRPPEEDLLFRSGTQQGTVWPNIGPRWASLSRFQSNGLHGPFQSTDNEPLPPQPRTDARVSRAQSGGVVSWPVAQRTESGTTQPSGLSLPATPASQLRHRLHLTPTGQVSWRKWNVKQKPDLFPNELVYEQKYFRIKS